MGSNLLPEYLQVLKKLDPYNIPLDLMSSMRSYGLILFRADQQNRFSEPMPWIGMYIALASLYCVLAMVVDLLHGFQNRKLWFPCKHFTLNAASLSVIAVAMKLPMDLNNPMSGNVDRMTKFGSMAFICTMMANLLPSLATMGSKELLTNIIALGVLVITLVVNVCIEIKTGVLSYNENRHHIENFGYIEGKSPLIPASGNGILAIFYVVLLLMLLVIHICSSLAILKSKQILESKYQVCHKTTTKDQEFQPGGSTVERLKQHVSNYWIMAGTGNPEFMIACSATTSASGVICAISSVVHTLLTILMIEHGYVVDYKSDYKWSMLVIFVIQFIRVILGTIAPLTRCFADLSFKLSITWIWNHMKVFKVEHYWTQKLSDWKHNSLPFPFSSGNRRCKIVVQNLKILILSLCIGFQKSVVITCKMLVLIPIIVVICVVYCFHCWKWLKAMFTASGIVLVERPKQLEQNDDLSLYVLQLQDDMELAERTVKGISKSMKRLIERAENQQPRNLMKLLDESTGFEGVEKFDCQQVPPLLSEEVFDCWSLPVITLTTVAISLSKIHSNIVDRLVSSVDEGLVYVRLVEESLNAADDYVRLQKVAKTLWLEVEVYHKWLGNKLQSQVSSPRDILQWFRDTAKSTVTELGCTDVGGGDENSISKSISANSMYRITETILLSNQDNIDEVSQEELFSQLSSMISDIVAACLTNLPRVIALKCDESLIEKREASVHAAAQLLGETTQIMNILQNRELPSLNLDEMAFIKNWRAYLKHSIP